MPRYLVTGATRGIGRALVELLSPGNELIALGRDAGELAKLPVVERIATDLSSPDAIAAALPSLDDLDAVIHCAGALEYRPVEETQPADWHRAFDLNVVSAAELTRLLLPALRAARGTVVFVNSGQGLSAARNLSTYAASKHALRALADGLRAEEPGLRVCSVYLGRVATDMQRQLRAAEQSPYEADQYVRPATVAEVIAGVLRLPPDAAVTDLTLRPRNR